MWDLWCTNWHCERLSFKYCGFPLLVSWVIFIYQSLMVYNFNFLALLNNTLKKGVVCMCLHEIDQLIIIEAY
jgi:hypothetical protein